jgi:hypothetical protein
MPNKPSLGMALAGRVSNTKMTTDQVMAGQEWFKILSGMTEN